MDHPPCFNTYNNISHQQRSQTLQPMRGNLHPEPNFILQKFFQSTHEYHNELEYAATDNRANYANVGPVATDHSLALALPRHHYTSRPHHHQHVHSRSQSQHYHHMNQSNDPINLNNYYNLSNIDTIIPARSRHSPANAVAPMPNQTVPLLDSMTMLQILNELGQSIDTSPSMPPSKKYTISGSSSSGFFKVFFPQCRVVKGKYTDPLTQISIKPGETVSVLGYSRDDRSKFTVCYKDTHIDMPHQLTIAPGF